MTACKPVQSGDCVVSVALVGQRDEAKALGLARLAILGDEGILNLAVLLKGVAQVVVCGLGCRDETSLSWASSRIDTHRVSHKKDETWTQITNEGLPSHRNRMRHHMYTMPRRSDCRCMNGAQQTRSWARSDKTS